MSGKGKDPQVEVERAREDVRGQQDSSSSAANSRSESNQESRATSDNLSQDLTPGSANKDEGCADPVDVGVKEPEDDTGKTDQVSNSPEIIEESMELADNRLENTASSAVPVEVIEVKDEPGDVSDQQNQPPLDPNVEVKQEKDPETQDFQALLYQPSQDSACFMTPKSPLPSVVIKTEDIIKIEGEGKSVEAEDPERMLNDEQQVVDVTDPWDLVDSSRPLGGETEVNTETILGDPDKEEEESYIMDYSARTEEELLKDSNDEDEVNMNSTRILLPDPDFLNNSLQVQTSPDEAIPETQETEAVADETVTRTSRRTVNSKRRIIYSESDSSDDSPVSPAIESSHNDIFANSSSDSEESIVPVAVTSKETFQDALNDLFAQRKRYAYLSRKHRMKILLESGDLSDTTFLVGPRKAPIKAHKYILYDKSEFFSTLFSERWTNCGSQAGHIEIPDIEPDDFRSFLEFLYAGDVNLRKDNALPLLYLSRLYGVPILGERAVNYLRQTMSPETAFPVFASLFDFADGTDVNAQRLFEEAATYISKNAMGIFKKTSRLQCKISDVAKLFKVKEDKMYHTQEFEIFLACYELAKKECQQNGLEINGSNCRTSLEPLMQYIRFPLLNFNDYYEVRGTNILTEEESNALRGYIGAPHDSFADSLSDVQQLFNPRPRILTEFACNRFGEIRTRPKSWVYGRKRNKPDRISFKVNTDIVLRAIGLFGCAEPERPGLQEPYKLEISISYHENTHGRSLYSATEDAVDGLSASNGRLFKVPLRRPLNLIAGVPYTVSLQVLQGDRTYFGMRGKPEVLINCQNYHVRFEFEEAKSRLLDNGSGVTIGQIPVLYFSLGKSSRITDVEIIDE